MSIATTWSNSFVARFGVDWFAPSGGCWGERWALRCEWHGALAAGEWRSRCSWTLCSHWRPTQISTEWCRDFRSRCWWKLMMTTAQRNGAIKSTYFLGIIKSSRNPSLLYKSHRFSFECSTLFVESRSSRIFRRRYFSRIDLNRRSASVAAGVKWKKSEEMSLRQITLRQIDRVSGAGRLKMVSCD